MECLTLKMPRGKGVNANTLVQENYALYHSRVTILRATNSFLRSLIAGKQKTRVSESSATPGPNEIVEGSFIRRTLSLYAFVDLKDPFSAADIAGEELPGPILSIMSALSMSRLYLFHTPHTRNRADATRRAVLERHAQCLVRLWEISTSDPKNYSSLMGPMTRTLRDSIRPSTLGEKNYVCVSSGTAEMRAIWFLLTALGILEATLLQVGSPASPWGEVQVREVGIDTVEWETLHNLVMPESYFGPEPRSRQRSWIPRGSETGSSNPREILDDGARQDEDRHVFSPSAKKEKKSTDHAWLSDEKTDAQSETSLSSRLRSRIPRGFEKIAPSLPLTPGVDEALQELGIHVGSAMLRHAAEQAAIAAGSHLPVLLLGETGTGKERFAHLIHKLSPQSEKDLVAINCAAVPEEIAESYLFGHVKGSFTGASNDKLGMFEQANGSTLFLDEVAELSLDVQAKLLRVIQDGVVQRIGATLPRKVNVRIVAATNRDLRKEVAAGRFREDLYFRLEVVCVRLPGLRERRGEIAELALALLKQINQRRHKPRQLSKDALRRLEGHAWPGNVRELSNVLERSVLYAQNDVVNADDLLITSDHAATDILLNLPEPFPGFSIKEYLARVRNQLFSSALAACNGNQAEAASRLGISKEAVSKFVRGIQANPVDGE